MTKNFPTGTLVAGALVVAAVLLGAGLGSAATPDRSQFANQMQVNPDTGEILSGPSNYTDVGAADRSAYAASMTVNPNTGEVQSGPSEYTGVGTPDRSLYASKVTGDSNTGEITGGPSEYTNVRTPDRRTYAAAMTMNTSTGELTGGPNNYASVAAKDRRKAAAMVQADPNSGEVTGGPSTFARGAGDLGGLNVAYNRSTATISLSWNPSCLPDDSDYDVYEGNLTRPWVYAHQPRICGTGGATNVSFTTSTSVSSYYLLVPRSSSEEGSYGTASNSAQIPVSSSACLPQEIVATCP